MKERYLNFIKNNKNFILLWVSQILSQISLNMINFVMATRIYEKTGSTLLVSFIWIFYYLPAFFLGPFAGYFIDHWSKRKILLVANILQGLSVLLYLPIGDSFYYIYPIVFLYSLLNQFYAPAEGASLPSLVNKKDLPLTNSLFMITAQTSLIIGFGVSGILMRFFGRNNPIYISALALFVAAVSVFYLPKDEPQKKAKADIADFVKQIKFGYQFIKDKKIVLFPILLMSAIQVFLVVLGVAVPEFAKTTLGLDIRDAGPALIMPLGIGALLGTYILTKFLKFNRKKYIIKRGFLFAFLVFTVFSLLINWFGDFKAYFAFLLMIILGFSGILIFIPSQTLVQENTPAFLRGRVFGAWGFISNAITFPFLLFSASIIDILGVRMFLFLIGLFCLAGYIFFNRVEGVIIDSQNGNK